MPDPDPAAPDVVEELRTSSTAWPFELFERAAAEIARLRAEVAELGGMPWPCTCGRTSTLGCEKCDPRDARIAELEAALRRVRATVGKASLVADEKIADLASILDRALGEETRGG